MVDTDRCRQPTCRPTRSETSTTSAPRKVNRGSNASENRDNVSMIVSSRIFCLVNEVHGSSLVRFQEQFQRLMADHGVASSLSRSGNGTTPPWKASSSSLMTERTARRTYRTRDEAKADVFDCIERFYNPKRRNSTIEYPTPMEFEMRVG